MRQQIMRAMQEGQYPQALELLARAMKLAPREPSLPYNRGLIYVKLQQTEQALAEFDLCLKLNPKDPLALNERGICLCRLGRNAEGVESFKRSLDYRPDHVGTWSNLGLGLRALKQNEEALAAFDKALSLEPTHTDAMLGRSAVLSDLHRGQEALDGYNAVLKAGAATPEAHCNRGAALFSMQRHDEAMASYNLAIALNPNYANAYRNRGLLQLELRRLPAARLDFEQAYTLDAGEKRNLLDIAMIDLMQGDFARGWEGYESRRQVETYPDLPGPYWLGDAPLEGKTILLHGEQGLGDTLQFCRYVPMVKARGARVLLLVQKPLIEFLSTLPGVDLLAKAGDTLPPFDTHCHLMSLPYAFRTTLETIPPPPRLGVMLPKIEGWVARTGKPGMPRIGLCWSGSHDHSRDHHRSIPLAEFAKALPPGVNYIALQKELRDADREALKSRPDIQWVGDGLEDFTDSAALIATLDLVISVDTSIAHLAGTMQKPLALLLSYVPDFRWMLNRNDTPWYPSATLYRQPALNDWSSVLKQIRQEIETALRGNA